RCTGYILSSSAAGELTMNAIRRRNSSPTRPISRFAHLFFLVTLMFAGVGLAVQGRSSAQSANVVATTDTTITTVAGGGFGSDVPAKAAPMVLPTGVTFDPLGRGFYVIDEVDGTSLLRFVNTSTSPVTLSGVTIQPGSINLIAGGGVQSSDGISPRDT